jgi:hypothetical protein
MKHLYCTVAVGDYYLNSAIKMAKKLNEKSDTHHFLITTNIDIKEIIPNTTIKLIPDGEKLFIGDCFNYMLKYYPLYLASEMDYDHIIFIDADWRIRDFYDQDKIKILLNHMDSQEYDIFFERPYNIGAAKIEGRECIFHHKIEFYDLLNTTQYDEGHMCNEQFILFKNNDKFKVFINKLKELYIISTAKNLWPFAEGLEMGMSMATAKMKVLWDGWHRNIENMYEFNSKDGGLSVKF